MGIRVLAIIDPYSLSEAIQYFELDLTAYKAESVADQSFYGRRDGKLRPYHPQPQLTLCLFFTHLCYFNTAFPHACA